MMDGPIKLDFSEKYDDQHAQRYLQKHQDGLGRKLSHWRDVQLARKALKLVGEQGWSSICRAGQGVFGQCWRRKPIERSSGPTTPSQC